MAVPAISQELGTIPGEFAVNGNGGATYSVSIEVPPGINGVQPNLSLVYNNQQQNGLLGMDWQLAGLSAIARCGKTIATDGTKGGVNFDSEDRFCWDGQRLIAVNGEYGADGTEYRTERETWAKVVSHTVDGKNGPRWFSLTTKDGHQLEFGNTEDSKILAAEDREDEAVRVWALNQMSDRNGNIVEASYQIDAQEPSTRVKRSISTTFLGYFPTEIRYTGNSNSGVAPQRLVKFDYEDRDDKIIVYAGGSKAETTRRLAHIKTYVDLDGDGSNLAAATNLVKDYHLIYEYGPGTNFSRLIDLQECDSAGACLPATKLTYQDGELAFSESSKWNDDFGNISTHPWQWNAGDYIRLMADVDGDGREDIVGFGEDGVYVSPSNGIDFDESQKWISEFGRGNRNINQRGWLINENPRLMADVDGDGLSDIVGFADNGVYISRSNGIGFDSAEIWINEFGVLNNNINNDGWTTDKHIRLMADIDGDGRSDVIGFGNNGIYVSQSNGEGFDPAQEWIDDFGYRNYSGSNNNEGWLIGKYPRTMADANGDGLLDVVGFGYDGVYVALSDGESFQKDEGARRWINYFGWNGPAGGWNDENYIRTMSDVNGDGLSDIVGFGRDGVEVSLSDGIIFNPQSLWINYFGSNGPAGGWTTKDDLRMMADVNGDSFSDIVGFGNQGVEVSLSDGAVTFGPYDTWIDDFTSEGPTGEWTTTNSIRMMADSDGDGQADVVGFGNEGVYVSLSKDKSDLITKIVNGLGEVISIEYAPLTDSNVYTKGTGAVYPKVDIQTPIYVVSKHEIAESETNPVNTFTYQHQYEGAKIDRHRGWLGFEKTTLVDVQNQTQTTTNYHTDFPLLGLVSGREIQDIQADQLLGKMSSDYEYSKDADGIYKFWQTDVTMESYTAGNYNYTLKRSYEYDDNYQNAVAISDLGDIDDPNDNAYTCLAYAEGTGEEWWKSFFPSNQKTIQSSAEDCGNFSNWNAATDLRWEQFSYDDLMNLTGHSNWQDKSSPDTTQGKWLNTTMSYDVYGNVITLTDSSNNTSSISYDSTYHTFPARHETPATSNGSLVVSTEYEPKFGIKTKIIDANGNTAMLIPDSGLDGFGRVLEVRGIKPDSSDLVTLSKSELLDGENGLSIKTWYRTQWEGQDTPDDTWLWEEEYIDGLGRTYKSEGKGHDGKTIASKQEFNSVGQVGKEFLPYYTGDVENFFAYEYDVRGNVIETTNPVNAIARSDYDSLGDARNITFFYPDPSDAPDGNNLVDALVKNTSRGWEKEKIAPDESSASYSYDRLGQAIGITDPLGQETTMVYNSLGQVISETTRETGTNQYFYNDNGKVTSQIDAKGQKISLEYDALGRVIEKEVYDQESDSTPTTTIVYEYDDPSVENGKGALTKIVIAEATYTFSYDNRGQLKQEKVAIDTDGNGSQETYISQYTYDAAGRPNNVTYPDGAIVRYTYNEGGELSEVALKDTGENDFTAYATYEEYNALGGIGKVTYNPNLVESNYTYDALGRIATSKTTKAAQTYFDFSYTWNKADKLLAISDNASKGLNQNFGYNIVGRLSSANGDPYEDLSYEYDVAGNITKRNDTTYEYKPDKKHQLADATYDDNGNTTQDGSWTYTYDAQDQLLKVDRETSGTVNEFTYDDSGDRLSKIESDGTVTYYVAPLYEVVRNADSSQVHTKYIVGPQGAIAAISKDGDDVNLIAAIKGNSTNLEAELYDPHSWTGLAQFLSAKFNQLAFSNNVAQILVAWVLVAWLLCALWIWMYRFWRSASRESWTGKSRAMVAQISVTMGWITPETAEDWIAPQAKGWLLQTGHRPISFALALISFSSVSLSGPNLLAELTPADSGGGYPIAGQVLYFHYDQLGSTTLVTDANANIVSQVNYEPYGAIADSSTGEDNFRPKFTGKEYDSNSELYYFGSRYYDANLGRFLTPDPASQYFSPYVYGNGDPLSGIDPNGQEFVTLTIIVIGATVGAYMGGATVNDSFNPASWDWSSGKTWGGVVGGAALGGASAGVGIAAGGAIAAAGLSTTATAAANMALAGGIMGTMNASFTAMGGGDAGDVAAAFGIGFGTGALFAAPYIGPVVTALDTGYNAVLTITDPSVENGIQLGMDILSLGIDAGTRLKKGGKQYAEVGGCASFVAGTEVATAEGEKAIEEVAVGDTVLAYNEKTGEEGEYPVTHLFTRIAPESIVVTVGEEVIATTPEHEFYTANGWVEAEDLQIGETLVRLGGKVATVTDLESRPDSTRVYNFEVDEAHTYYVSGNRVLVHNMMKACANLLKPPTQEYTHMAIDKNDSGLNTLRKSLNENGLQTAERRNIKLSEGSEKLRHHQHVFMWDSSEKGMKGADGIESRGGAVRVRIRKQGLNTSTLKGDNMGQLGGKSTNGAWAYEGDIPRKYLFIEGIDTKTTPGYQSWLEGKGWLYGHEAWWHG
ncbi:polymorphic toxin-type HINT domain-containing protein [Okeania sp. SIO1I7]|uniref:polymorphic toxin-type HINT domain-containing protein n=1 Tax=Okeania sp. SIO1I7 TaxID=2607772 RepID=UPI0013F9CE72|nr:polymorphic toxin-type HINT domain-containing protein [Okeania sp. SIO1I7]NET24404.1 hypothetical protein [Okeania sp. SIO1I7]